MISSATNFGSKDLRSPRPPAASVHPGAFNIRDTDIEEFSKHAHTAMTQGSMWTYVCNPDF